MPCHSAQSSTQEGFSLIELSIVMIVIGIIMVGVLDMQRLHMANKTYADTRTNIADINKAISIYVSRNSRLPCPASLNAKRSEESYGVAPDCKELLAFISPDKDKTHLIVNGRDDEKVIIGRIPFRELNIAENTIKDGWRKDLFYAVSANLTDMEKYDQFKGVINVVDDYGRSLIDINTGAQYVLFSTGVDTAIPGDEACDVKRPDGENCNADGTFRVSDISLGNNESFFDDVVSYVVWVPPPPNVTGQCNIVHQLLSYPDIELSDIKMALGEDQPLTLSPGDMLFLCNRPLLKKMNMDSCILMNCRADNVLQIVEQVD